jgi:hypothetical protein
MPNVYREKATQLLVALRPGDVIAAKTNNPRFDIQSFWLAAVTPKGQFLFETSEAWTSYLPADAAGAWWDFKGSKETRPAEFAKDTREYVDLIKQTAAKTPAYRKAQPICGTLKDGGGICYLYYVVTREDLLPKREAGAAKASIPPARGTGAVAGGVRGGIDLLRLIDVKRDAVAGTWKVDNGIESDLGGGSRLAIRYDPPEEYDFRIEFTRLAGTASLCQSFTVGDRRVAWIAGWADRVRGFEVIGGRDASGNPSTVGGPAISDIGQRYSSVVEVRKGSIAAYLDGKLVKEYKTDGSDLTSKWDFRGLPLGICTIGNQSVFHVIEVVEVSGRGRPIP